MSSDRYAYVALICSLPVCGDLFAYRNTPISRFQLHLRLRELAPQDHLDLVHLSAVLDWHDQPRGRSDAELLTLYRRKLTQIHCPEIRRMLAWRMEFRTVVAALRRRHAGEPAPAGHWGTGRWQALATRHWREPELGLGKHLPWVAQAAQMLDADDAKGLEKLLLAEVWQWLERCSWEHEFDLAAVAIYRLRWDLISRWVRYRHEPAQARFAQMVAAITGDTASAGSGFAGPGAAYADADADWTDTAPFTDPDRSRL